MLLPLLHTHHMQSNQWWRLRLSLTLTSRFDPLTCGCCKLLLSYKHYNHIKRFQGGFCIRWILFFMNQSGWIIVVVVQSSQRHSVKIWLQVLDSALCYTAARLSKWCVFLSKDVRGKHRFSLMYNDNTGKSRESEGKLKQSPNCVCWSECQLLWKLQGRWGCQQLLFNNQTHQHRLREEREGALLVAFGSICVCVFGEEKEKGSFG